MEDFLLVVLLVAVVWLAVRLSRLSARVKQLEGQQHRLSSPAAPAYSPATAPPASAQPTVVPALTVAHTAPPATAPYRAPYIPPPPPVAIPAPPIATPRPAPPPAAVNAPRPAPTPPTFATPREPKPHVSLEARLGQNWLNKLGITALVIGLALGLGKLITYIGPLGKDAIGFALALGLLALGLFLERKPTYKLFGRVLIGGGWALTFFLTFALYHVEPLRILHSEGLDLTLMFLVAAGMVAHSLRYRSQTVTTLAFLLAFVTVGLSNVTLFSLVAGAILTAALALIVYRERWYALGLAGLLGVYFNHFLWLHRVLPNGGLDYLHTHHQPFPDFLPSALLLLAYWLLFRLVYVFRPPLAIAQDRDHDVNQTLATTAALLNSAGLLGLLKYQSSHPEWAFYGLIALGLVELAFALIARGGLKPDTEAQPNRIAFITLSSLASVMLLAAIPFRFHSTAAHNSGWPLLWLLEAEAFYLTGIRLPERVFRRLGLLASLLTGVLITLAAQAQLSLARPITHAGSDTAIFLSGAALLWFNAEFTTRRWRTLLANQFDTFALRLSSYLAAVLAAVGLTLLLHPTSAWLGVTWLLLALALAQASDSLHARDLATQSDILALLAILRTLATNLWLATEHTHGLSTRLLTLSLTAALLYLATRRRTAAYTLPVNAIAATYSWLAAAIVALLCWYQLEPIAVAVAWGVFGLILFELSYLFKRNYLRHQAYALLAASFIRIFFANLQVPGSNGTLSPSLYTVLPLIAAFAYVYERIHSAPTPTRIDRIAGIVFAWCSVIAAATLLYFELQPAWVVLAWTVLAIALLALATSLKRPIFVAQSLVVLAAVAVRAIGWHLFSPAPLATTLTTSRVFTIGLTSALLLLALPLAFHLRSHFTQSRLTHETSSPLQALSTFAGPITALLHHPEQPFYFVPLTLLTLLLYVHFSGGRITIAWVVLGLCAFLFALTVKERTYRLSGLGLLLLAVAKVLAWDVWHASPTDRYLTLIIMGASLLLVSFLYSRYKETLLKLL